MYSVQIVVRSREGVIQGEDEGGRVQGSLSEWEEIFWGEGLRKGPMGCSRTDAEVIVNRRAVNTFPVP